MQEQLEVGPGVGARCPQGLWLPGGHVLRGYRMLSPSPDPAGSRRPEAFTGQGSSGSVDPGSSPSPNTYQWLEIWAKLPYTRQPQYSHGPFTLSECCLHTVSWS